MIKSEILMLCSHWCTFNIKTLQRWNIYGVFVKPRTPISYVDEITDVNIHSHITV